MACFQKTAAHIFIENLLLAVLKRTQCVATMNYNCGAQHFHNSNQDFTGLHCWALSLQYEDVRNLCNLVKMYLKALSNFFLPKVS